MLIVDSDLMNLDLMRENQSVVYQLASSANLSSVSNDTYDTIEKEKIYGTVGYCTAVSTHSNHQPLPDSPNGFDKHLSTRHGFYDGAFAIISPLASYAFEVKNHPYAMHNNYEKWAELQGSSEIKLLKLPEHGKFMIQQTNGSGNDYNRFSKEPLLNKYFPNNIAYGYKPDNGFVGTDSVVFMVKIADKEIKLVYFIQVTDQELIDINNQKELCPNNKNIWIISSDNSITPPKYLNFENAYPVEIGYEKLVGSAVGQAVGYGLNSIITIDVDAAGHDWHTGGMTNLANLNLDANFAQNLGDDSNWLPTSQPNEWVAKVGSDADGRMDMLSVLLHEYGHTLGLEHNLNPHNYMAATLTSGVPRLPTHSDMQLMAQLAGEAREAIMAGEEYTLA